MSTPQHEPAKWTTRKTVAATAIAAGIVAAGGAAIFAAGGSDSASASPGGMSGGGPGGSQQSALANALHGEFVVSDGNGGYTTESMQVGTVAAVNSTSLTAKSTDGYTKTYTIDSSTAVGDNATISSIATGDTVTVVAKLSGGSATAETVTEGTGAGQGGQPGGQPGQQEGTLPRQGTTNSGNGQTTGQG